MTLFIASGVILADLLLLTLAYTGVEALVPAELHIGFWVQIMGALLLLGLGIGNILKKNVSTEGIDISKTKLIAQNLAKGFFLNILNPTNFMEWVGTVGILKHRFGFDFSQSISFFTGALLMVLMTEISIIFFAGKLKQVMNESVRRKINVVSGILFCIIGVWMLIDAFI